MHREFSAAALLMSLIVSGCATVSSGSSTSIQNRASDADHFTATKNQSRSFNRRLSVVLPAETHPKTPTRLVAYQEEIRQSDEHTQPIIAPVVAADEQASLALDDLEPFAIANNPTLVQANAQVEAEYGAAHQAGLPYNPVIGYAGEQIGVNGTAGELQGGFVSQEFVTGGKLRLSRAKYAQRAKIAATNACAQQQRVLNDLRAQFYRALAAQHLVEIHRKLVSIGEDNVQTHREMQNLGQTSESDVLQADVEFRRDRLRLQDAEHELQLAQRVLFAMAGCPQLASTQLQGKLSPDQVPLEYDSAREQLLGNSPELAATRQKIRHDEIAVERERAQPIPNILVDAKVGRNYDSGDTTAGVNIGIPLPIFDRNLGTIQQAQADLTRAHAEAQRLELELQTRLATEYRAYLSAWQYVQEFENTILPKAQTAYELLVQSYENRRAPWVDVMTAQRLQMILEIEYVESLRAYRESDVAIRGMLLTGGLTEPLSAVSGGHIDATPKPR